ncbi:MAG: trypsin-like serine protease [Chloroflexaceae bacterium]|nr:trypsin-like serine protease [Chloroflexaceae bacterium]
MKPNPFRWLRQLSTPVLGLLLGVVLAFSSFPLLSSQAETALAPAQDLTVAQVPSPRAAQSFVTAAVVRSGPAVVRVDTERVITRRADPFLDDPFFREFFGDRFSQQVPRERQVRGQGSGFIIDRSGIILTNAHVVSRADRVTVTLKDGRTFDGEVKGTDEVTDLAVIKIDSKGQALPVAPLGDSSAVEVGDWAIAVGNPVGLDSTVTLGIISTLNRSSAQVGIPDKRVDFLQTDAAINPGNSGGPLLNDRGEVIGINTAIRADAMGIGFAIPINKAKALTATLAAGKQVPHPFVGIQMVAVTPDLAKQNNQDPNSPFIVPEVTGVLVVRVLPDTPAERAGLRRGDVITKINDRPIDDAGELQSLVEQSGIDAILKFTVVRGDRTLELPVRTQQMQTNS